MVEVNNICLELNLIEDLRRSASVPLVQMFRLKVRDVLVKERKIIFRTKYGYKNIVKIDKVIFKSLVKFIDENALLSINYIFLSNSKQNAIGKSRYFTILWRKNKLGSRQKICKPRIYEEQNELSHLLPEELLHPSR